MQSTMEGINDMEQFLTDEWHEIAELVQEEECVVYIDSLMIECLHWYTGGKVYSFFKNAGAIAVYQLSSEFSENIEVKNCKKAIIISASIDRCEIETILTTITLKNAFEHITIACPGIPEIQDYNREKVKIFPHSIFLNPIDSDLFLIPSFAEIVPSLTDMYLTTTSKETINNLKDKIETFVNLLNELFFRLNVKEDIYFMGEVSKYIADMLEMLPAAIDRRNNVMSPKKKGVSLIFVDRVLDLCTPTSNNTESLLSRILCTLPPLPDHHNDVAIDMSPLFQNLQDSDSEKIPGCLASNRTLINTLITKNQKDVLTTLNDMLVDILSTKEKSKLKDSLKLKPATRISAHSLEKLVNKFKEVHDLHTILESSNKLQIVLGIIQALTSKKMSQLELLISLEKLVLQNVAVSRYSTSVLGQLSTIIRTRNKRGLDTDNIFTLLVHIYALAGTEIVFSFEQEQQLIDAIADALLEDNISLANDFHENLYMDLSKYQTYINKLTRKGKNDQTLDKEKIVNHAKVIMKRLHTIAQQRNSLQDYSSLISKSSSQEIVRRIGILQQLLTDVLHPDRPELSDLHHSSSSFISSKLNLFKEKAIPHPCDNSWIIVYVVGGITAEEVREAREIISLFNPKCKVTITSSIFLKPTDITFKYLLLDDDCY
ncbi:sec1 family domain-containing protein 2-like isoform X2 [Pseudomyrmex gracilis]|nr:sec1 family domain-containing protein 2-like isoform X2 [Pseudomyrmex gracilis]XP_020296110.1 sec1 family domain-containing protein 2-like isoform X2 [Pseudomyrmex gracilis]XP_020296111.1 sec1 family domain-containing protein 2-like isoform X2 [Pseudomyrmex gracilis]XP_020296112.1 sec1 family domain-containing protein 2-like isoform X2 [Pseudomyrmex gracilis]